MQVSLMERLWNGFIYDKAVAAQRVSEKLNSVTNKFKKIEVNEVNNEDINKEATKKDVNNETKEKEVIIEEKANTDTHLEPEEDNVIDVEAREVTEEKIEDVTKDKDNKNDKGNDKAEVTTEEDKETNKEDVHLGPDFSFNKKDDTINAEAHEVTEEKLNEALNKEKRRDGHKNSDHNKKETGFRAAKNK